MPKSMLDSEFLDGGQEIEGQQDDRLDNGEKWTPPEPTEIDTRPAGKVDEQNKITVEIDDDTPEKDRGKWVANDKRDGEPEFPTEEEIRSYSKGAQTRIHNMTARVHAERRRAEDLTRQYTEAEALMKRLLEENNNLKGMIENGEKILMGEHKGRLEMAVAQARAKAKEAHDAGDSTAFIAAQEELARAVAQLDRAGTYRPTQMQREDASILEKTKIAQQQATPDEAAQKWAAQNKWFGRDDAMTGYALGYHKQLTEREGISPTDKEYYQRLNAEMRRRFPDRFGERERAPQRQSSPVAPVARTGSTAPRTVRITESQAKLARRLGLTVEQYAEQVLAEEGNQNGRSYTHN